MDGQSLANDIAEIGCSVFVFLLIGSCHYSINHFREMEEQICESVQESIQERVHDSQEKARKIAGKPKELKEKADELFRSGKETAKDVFENYMNSRKIFNFPKVTEEDLYANGKKAYRELKWSVPNDEPSPQTETSTDDGNVVLPNESSHKEF